MPLNLLNLLLPVGCQNILQIKRTTQTSPPFLLDWDSPMRNEHLRLLQHSSPHPAVPNCSLSVYSMSLSVNLPGGQRLALLQNYQEIPSALR